MRWMLILNNWTRFLGYLEWPEQLWKRHLKPIPKTNQCFVLFYIWIGGAKRGKEYWDRGPWERKSQPYRKFRAVGAKCPEFGMQRAVIKLLSWASEEPIFIFSHTKMTTLRWLHNTTNTTDDSCCSPGWRNYPVDPVICYSNSWLCLLLASNLTTIQLGPNYHVKYYSLNVLPVGTVPKLITKIPVI